MKQLPWMFVLLTVWLRPATARAVAAGADFLRAEIPARPAALAGAFSGFSDDANAFLWNPAALGSAREPMLSATHFTSIIDTDFNQAAYAQPLRISGTASGLGLWVQHSSTSNFSQVDALGNDLGAVENYDLVVGIAGGLKVTQNLSLGLGAKGFNSRLAEFKARGFAVDLGAQSRLSDRLTLGLAFLDLGAMEAYDKTADPLPTLLRLGAKYQLVSSKEVQILTCAQMDRPWSTGDPILFGIGAEYWYSGRLALRAGWRFGSELGQLSLGAGLRWKGMRFDYTYHVLGDLGITHRFSLGAELGTFFAKAGVFMDTITGERETDESRRVKVDPALR